MPTILLVDDEQTLLENLRYVLEADGHTVLAANSVDSAMRISQKYREVIDILVSDMDLRPLNGAQLGTALRVHRPSLAVILMSGTPLDSFPDRDTASIFLQKPFAHIELRQAVSAVCAGHCINITA